MFWNHTPLQEDNSAFWLQYKPRVVSPAYPALIYIFPSSVEEKQKNKVTFSSLKKVQLRINQMLTKKII